MLPSWRQHRDHTGKDKEREFWYLVDAFKSAHLVAKEVDQFICRVDSNIWVRLAQAVDPFLLGDDVEFDTCFAQSGVHRFPCGLLGRVEDMPQRTMGIGVDDFNDGFGSQVNRQPREGLKEGDVRSCDVVASIALTSSKSGMALIVCAPFNCNEIASVSFHTPWTVSPTIWPIRMLSARIPRVCAARATRFSATHLLRA
jgi:hypothetical protein